MKLKTIYVCQECGFRSAKWIGKCTDCEAWNSFIEETDSLPDKNKRQLMIPQTTAVPVQINAIELNGEERFSTNISELDRILGGGIVEGSVVLIGGEPGIGKSTLLLQMGYNLSKDNRVVLYVSAEESLRQTKLRAERLGVDGNSLYILNETNLASILEHVRKINPKVVIVDSVQIIYRPELESIAGSVSQVKECAGQLTYTAKATGTTIFLVGHVTKEGAIAGPRILEHMVDTVLYFEGARHTSFRLLRAVKNRFGTTNEIGVFEMTSLGLKEVLNPSELLLSERSCDVAGSVVVPCLEGTRPLLVEIQALVSSSIFGNPIRRTMGLDYNKTSLLAAVMEKRADFKLINKDIFVNVAGGIKVDEPAADLGVVLSVASSYKNAPLSRYIAVAGEVGLGGEIRAVNQIGLRIGEAQKLGFKKFILPRSNLKNLNFKGDLQLVGVGHIEDALKAAFEIKNN
ncbi:MAG: DNA repair protein RadA [Candidatus Omnitrophota bacterium]